MPEQEKKKKKEEKMSLFKKEVKKISFHLFSNFP
jgi:hypothetical protein